MIFRRLGRTNLKVSVIGIGTCQLRMVPEQQAINTLKRSFSLGVNIVHTAPDYWGADDLVAEAVQSSGRNVIVCSQGYGDRNNCERIFEDTCTKLRCKSLQLFGIACADDREIAGENLWGEGGMIEFLLKKKREGRLLGTFCTTHGTPEYIRRLVESNAFDAIILAYNPLGFHLLSYKPDPPLKRELIEENRTLFSLFAERDIGLMLMKPLAGGLLCNGKAFKPQRPFPAEINAGDVLRYLLSQNSEVASVIPGTNSEQEAEENASAGFAPLSVGTALRCEIEFKVSAMKKLLCSRCGECDGSCSNRLPISWLFRAAYIENAGSMPFESAERLRYFTLHPWVEEAKCWSCRNITCLCPIGIDIRSELLSIHERMKALRQKASLPIMSASRLEPITYDARLAHMELDGTVAAGRKFICRLALDNTGTNGWHLASGQPKVSLKAIWKLAPLPRWKNVCQRWRNRQPNSISVNMRGDVPTGQRCYLAFEISAPRIRGKHSLAFCLEFLMESRIVQQVFLGEYPIAI
jgi:uncharacterized protein